MTGVGGANAHPDVTPSPRVPQLSVRGKNRKELLGGFLRNIVKSADEALITGMSGLKVTWGAPSLDSTQGLKSPARIETLGPCGREATDGALPRGRLCHAREPETALLLVTRCEWVLSGSLRRWMTSSSMRGPSCWSTTPASGTPAFGQTESCTLTSVRRAPGALDSPQWPYSPGERREQEMPCVCPWPQTPGVGLDVQTKGL